MSGYEHILYAVSGRVATITLNRPDRMNALNDAMVEEIWAAAAAAEADRGVRAILLTGAGRAFCAGGDVGGFGGADPRMLITKQQRPFDMNRRPDYQTRHSLFPAIGKPIVAMINGAAAGLGLLYALFADIRIAAENAVFTTAFARRGLSAEYGMAWILRETVGHAHALDLLLSARKIDGREAQRIGLVQQCHPAEELAAATEAYVQELVEWCSPRSMRVIKQQVWDAPFQALHEAVMAANQDMLESNVSADFAEGTASFRERRKPDFPDPI